MAHVDFCGEIMPLVPGEPFVVGREGDLAFDDNPYLHRRFLVLDWRDAAEKGAGVAPLARSALPAPTPPATQWLS